MVSAPASELWRTALATFQKDYPEIRLELTGANSRDFWPRLLQERRAGQYSRAWEGLTRRSMRPAPPD